MKNENSSKEDEDYNMIEEMMNREDQRSLVVKMFKVVNPALKPFIVPFFFVKQVI